MNNTYNRILNLVTETGEPKRYTPPKGYRLQTPKEAEEIKNIVNAPFTYQKPKPKRHPDGRIIKPNKGS